MPRRLPGQLSNQADPSRPIAPLTPLHNVTRTGDIADVVARREIQRDGATYPTCIIGPVLSRARGVGVA